MCFLSIFPLAGLLIIMLLILVKVVSLKKKGVPVKAAQSKKPGIQLIIYPIFLLILLLWITALTEITFNLSPPLLPSFMTNTITTSVAFKITGAVFVFLSVLLMLITLVHFKSSLRFGMNSNNQGKLITTGIFSFSRNPFFLSIILYFIGQALIFPGYLLIAMAVLALAGIHFFILREEMFMRMHYRNQYNEYMQKVRRYI
jgi:protein-S-isoprenylcysteine O-methyltransferase Ste14